MKNIKNHGFTLLEMVVTITLMAVLSTFTVTLISRPILAYAANAHRAKMIVAMDAAIKMMVKDIQSALPNSIGPSGDAESNIKMYPIVSSGFYRKNTACVKIGHDELGMAPNTEECRNNNFVVNSSIDSFGVMGGLDFTDYTKDRTGMIGFPTIEFDRHFKSHTIVVDPAYSPTDLHRGRWGSGDYNKSLYDNLKVQLYEGISNEPPNDRHVHTYYFPPEAEPISPPYTQWLLSKNPPQDSGFKFQSAGTSERVFVIADYITYKCENDPNGGSTGKKLIKYKKDNESPVLLLDKLTNCSFSYDSGLYGIVPSYYIISLETTGIAGDKIKLARPVLVPRDV